MAHVLADDPRNQVRVALVPPVAASEATATPRQAGQGALRALMRLESEIRKVGSHAELAALVSNEARGLMRARQIFVLAGAPGHGLRIVAVSGLPTVERGAPFIQHIEAGLARLGADSDLDQRQEFRLSSLSTNPADSNLASYPLQEMLWLPFRDEPGSTRPGAKRPGGLLIARETAWNENDIALAEHLCDATGYAWNALAARPRRRRLRVGARTLLVAGAALLALTLIPVPMTILAPLEVVAREPFIVASGLDGVVEEILVEPNSVVRAGDTVARLASVELRNKLEIAEREVEVAAAKLQKATQLAFVDVRGRHEMGLMRSELDLRIAERNFSRSQLDKTQFQAGRSGIAVYGDRKDIVGRPISVGDKLMEIADPSKVDIEIDIPVSDALVVVPGAKVKLFLDSDPLDPLDAEITRADYKARPRDGATLAYRSTARIASSETATPRLGVRGTAQVYGEQVPLWFYLFRRPISAVRQWSGL